MTTRAVEAWTLEPLVKFVKEAGARLVLVMTSAGGSSASRRSRR